MMWLQRETAPDGNGRRNAVRSALALGCCLVVVTTTSAQYDWTPHLGPQQTGFEQTKFGTWDLELMSVRGMIDRGFYESASYRTRRVRKIIEETRSPDAEASGPGNVFRRTTTHVDRRGRITSIEYGDPLTRKVIQRESFKYDDEGRLTEWRRARPPSEISVASISRILYPGRGPYGMAQTFEYFADGTLREWRACAIAVEQRLESCDEDYLTFDARGRIVAFGAGGQQVTITRAVDGNAVRIESREASRAEPFVLDVKRGGQIREVPDDTEDSAAGNRSWTDAEGRIVQYRVSGSGTPAYYWTATWEYGSAGKPTAIQKGLDLYRFDYDSRGRLVRIEQSLDPRIILRTYDAAGRLSTQQPPLFYRRMDPAMIGEERYTYDENGWLTAISVRDSAGQPVAETEFTYAGRDRD